MYSQDILEFQRLPIKFHTKYITHTLKKQIVYQILSLIALRFFKRSWNVPGTSSVRHLVLVIRTVGRLQSYLGESVLPIKQKVIFEPLMTDNKCSCHYSHLCGLLLNMVNYLRLHHYVLKNNNTTANAVHFIWFNICPRPLIIIRFVVWLLKLFTWNPALGLE